MLKVSTTSSILLISHAEAGHRFQGRPTKSPHSLVTTPLCNQPNPARHPFFPRHQHQSTPTSAVPPQLSPQPHRAPAQDLQPQQSPHGQLRPAVPDQRKRRRDRLGLQPRSDDPTHQWHARGKLPTRRIDLIAPGDGPGGGHDLRGGWTGSWGRSVRVEGWLLGLGVWRGRGLDGGCEVRER